MYDSPITLFETFDTVINEATKKHNKTVTAKILSKIDIDIDEKALTQALIQDMERYEEAYRRGYEDGKYEIKHGHWRGDTGEWIEGERNAPDYISGQMIDKFCCSWCGYGMYYKTPYCPNCGAMMDEEADDDKDTE